MYTRLVRFIRRLVYIEIKIRPTMCNC